MRGCERRIVAVVGCALACALATTPAQASWGSPSCSQGEHHHCYAVTKWTMDDPPESVKGGVAFITTSLIDVPEWATNAFVDDELWVSFQSSGGWFEAGQEAGSDINCCSLHAFWAYSLNAEGKGYVEKTYREFEDSPTSKFYIEDRGGNSDWCLYWAEDNVLVECKSGTFPPYADVLTAGIEAGSESRPYNEGSQEVAAVFREGTWHSWQGSKTAAVGEARTYSGAPESAMCIEPNWKSNAPGNAIWKIC
jgi:hypothetical protein